MLEFRILLGNQKLSKIEIDEVERKLDVLLQTELKTLRGRYYNAEVTILSGKWKNRKGLIKNIYQCHGSELYFTIHPISLKPPYDLLDPIYLNKKGFDL